MDVEKLISESIQEVDSENEKLIKDALKHSLRRVHETQAAFAQQRDEHTLLVQTIREGKFDCVAARFNKLHMGRA